MNPIENKINSTSDLTNTNKTSVVISSSSSSEKCLSSMKFIAFGNALVDISVRIENDKYLKKYNFGPNEQGECEKSKLENILLDVREEYSNIDYHPGGSAINTCRILSDLGETKLLFCGSIGNDEYGTILKDMLMKNNVNTCLQINDNNLTGICLCLIYEDNRCCFANIGSSIHFNPIKHDTLKNNLTSIFTSIPSSELLLTNQRICYIEGFFVTDNRFSICRHIYENYCKNSNTQTIFSTNLSAEYIIYENSESINYFAKKSDILFGNQSEFNALAKVNGFSLLNDQILSLLNFIMVDGDDDEQDHLVNNEKEKIIIVTNGDKCVDAYVKQLNGKIIHERFNVEPVKREEIVDTTGAGDAFVAGFFAAYMENLSIVECVRFGIVTASKKIRTIGAKLI